MPRLGDGRQAPRDGRYDVGDELVGERFSGDRVRWRAILYRYQIPEGTWAAHVIWVLSAHSWHEAEDHARKAQDAWNEYICGRRDDWLL